MKQLNVVGIGSPFGYKRLELLHGDITNLPDPPDLMVISAFLDDLREVPGTVIDALATRHDIDVEKLRQSSALDLTDTFGF